MTFAELQARAETLAEIWGVLNVSQVVDWGARVNDAYTDFLWESNSVHGPSVAMDVVEGQAEYTLPSPDWKSIEDVYYNGVPLFRFSEIELRAIDPYWLVRPETTPNYWWIVRHNVLRIFPTPDATTTGALTVYGIRAPALLSDPADVPALPLVLHEFIATYAAYLAAKPYAKGETRAVLADRYTEYVSRRDEWTREVLMRSANGSARYVAQITSDRVI